MAGPDPIVKEETAREAVDRIVEGFSRDAEKRGRLPDPEGARAFALPIVREQVQRHEEQRAPAATPATDGGGAEIHQRHLDEAGVEARTRRIGTVEIDPSRPLGQGIVSSSIPAELLRGARQRPLAEEREHVLLLQRLMLLGTHPDWAALLRDAFDAGCQAECRALAQEGMFTTDEIASGAGGVQRRIDGAGTKAVMIVVEASNELFGDWRTVRPRSQKITVG